MNIFRCLLLIHLMTAALDAEDIIPGIVSYDLPTFFTPSAPKSIPADDPPRDWFHLAEYLASDNRPMINHRQVNFSILRIQAPDAEIPGLLQKYVESFDQPANKPEATTLGGQRGWRIDHRVAQLSFREGAICHSATIWVRIRVDQILQVILTATGPELFPSLEQSLSRIKITPDLTPPSPKELKISTGTPLLGMDRATVRATCGPPLHQDPTSDIYFDGNCYLYADYSMPLLANLVFYKTSDGRAFLEAMEAFNQEKIQETLLPLSPDEQNRLLKKQAVTADEKPSAWKAIKENEWQREDGASAHYDPTVKILLISAKRPN